MTENQRSQLVESVRTHIGAKDLAQRLQNIKDDLHRTSKLEETLDKQLSPAEKILFQEDLEANVGSSSDPTAITNFLQKIIDEIQKMPVLTLEIAFNASAHFVNEVSKKLPELSNFLLDVKVNPAVVAGCVILFNGRRFDYSLASKITPHEEV